jgi:hypothetical protein
MSSREFEEWKILDAKFDPIGNYRMDIRGGMLMTALLNRLSAMFGQPGTVKPEDFLLKLIDANQPPQKMDGDVMETMLKSYAQYYKPDPKEVKLKPGQSMKGKK